MNEITKKQRWVLVPCLDYDVPAMESWLEEQAMQGLFLSKDDGFFLGLACFETGNPKRVRYRLGAVPKEKAFSEFDEKKQAAIALAEEMGWEFVAEWKEFLIYRCDDAHLPELNTDPAVQALSLKRVQGALADRVFSTCYYLFLYPILLFLLQQPTFLLGVLTVVDALGFWRLSWLPSCRRGARCATGAGCEGSADIYSPAAASSTRTAGARRKNAALRARSSGLS